MFNNVPKTFMLIDILGRFVEKAVATHSSTLAWKIPWTEEPGRLRSMGLQRVGDNWAISLSLFTFMHWRRKWQPTPVFLPGESQGQGAWWAAVCGVAQNWTWLKWLSSSSSPLCGPLVPFLLPPFPFLFNFPFPYLYFFFLCLFLFY